MGGGGEALSLVTGLAGGDQARRPMSEGVALAVRIRMTRPGAWVVRTGPRAGRLRELRRYRRSGGRRASGGSWGGAGRYVVSVAGRGEPFVGLLRGVKADSVAARAHSAAPAQKAYV